MKNKAMKHYFENKAVLDAAADTLNVICIVLLIARRLFPKVIYPKTIRAFFDDRNEYCTIADQDEQDEVFDYKMQRACKDKSIDTAACVKIVEKYMHPFNHQVKEVYVNNVKLIFVQLANECGLGITRRARLVSALLNENADIEKPVERIKEFGVEFEEPSVSQVDFKKYRRRPTKTTYQDQQSAREGLKWLKSYQDHVLSTKQG